MSQFLLKNLLLVDDSFPTNLLHRKIIKNTQEVKCIHTANNGIEALDFLTRKGKFKDITNYPEVILLDINMPKMNGFQFLDKYTSYQKDHNLDIMIVVLTTSSWENDKEKAYQNPFVHAYMEKPLDKEKIHRIIKDYTNQQVNNMIS